MTQPLTVIPVITLTVIMDDDMYSYVPGLLFFGLSSLQLDYYWWTVVCFTFHSYFDRASKTQNL